MAPGNERWYCATRDNGCAATVDRVPQTGPRMRVASKPPIPAKPASSAAFHVINVVRGERRLYESGASATSARLPSFLGAGEREDILGELAVGHVGDGHVLEYVAQVRAQRDPHLLQPLGRPGVLDLLGSLSANADQRTLHRADDVREIDLGGWARQPVAALGPTLTANDARGAQLREDVLQERHGDALGARYFVHLAGSVLGAVGGLNDRPHRIVSLGSDVHAWILTHSPAGRSEPVSSLGKISSQWAPPSRHTQLRACPASTALPPSQPRLASWLE